MLLLTLSSETQRSKNKWMTVMTATMLISRTSRTLLSHQNEQHTEAIW